MKLSVAFLLLLCGIAVCQIRQYIYINISKNWDSAQMYCRTNYVDLATITTDEENQTLMKTLTSKTHIWIGLNRATPGLDIWQWSDGEQAHFFNWMSKQPDNYNENENCVIMKLNGWNDLACEYANPFYCFWRFVLVTDSKTWGEAREYCRAHYTGLASPISKEQLQLAENELLQSKTVSVWTGLQFVNGQWISMSRSPLKGLVLLPSCPSQRYRCGALSTRTNIWENRDCSEKLNFLCY
ncbi:macrophage mannose receptor 1-like [Silurus meridionalis]|uniref:macrophage mannose receptor 1-like n=1 Tax=Silurus meridionalis TaxID=175797 RepID=UPI001EEB955E|nr:macrophage mannose receptor 1-like [Silurus meridionalis]